MPDQSNPSTEAAEPLPLDPLPRADMSRVEFRLWSQALNCPCCNYLGPLEQVGFTRTRRRLTRTWRCMQCKATIEVTVRS